MVASVPVCDLWDTGAAAGTVTVVTRRKLTGVMVAAVAVVAALSAGVATKKVDVREVAEVASTNLVSPTLVRIINATLGIARGDVASASSFPASVVAVPGAFTGGFHAAGTESEKSSQPLAGPMGPSTTGSGDGESSAPAPFDPGRSLPGATRVEFDQLRELVARNLVASSTFHPFAVLSVETRDGQLLYATYAPSQGPALALELSGNGVGVVFADGAGLDDDLSPIDILSAARNKSSSAQQMLPTILVVAFAILLLVFLSVWSSRKQKAGLKSKNSDVSDAVEVPATRFADVAGCEEAIEEMREVVDLLNDPERFARLGAKPPSGALLVGPPGTGKTLLARAVAGEAGVPFFAASGSDFVEVYVGVGAQRVRQLFAKAREAGKAIVFIDEIDAVGRARRSSARSAGGSEEWDQTLIALLNELDGFTDSNIVVLAATNRMDVLDPALLRPGRLDRKIQVPSPDRRGREAILDVHAAKVPLADDVDLAAVAARTPQMAGAELANVVNEAALEGVRRQLDAVDQACFDAAVATVVMGRARRSAVVSDEDREITAWHEAGHAVAALAVEEADAPVAVSIVPRGPAGGVTWMKGSDAQFLSRSRAAARLTVMLGGRAAEELLLDGEFTQGAYGDLSNATELAATLVTRFGMTDRGLMVRPPSLDGGVDAGSQDVVESLLAVALTQARSVLLANQRLVERIASELLERDDLNVADLAALVDEVGLRTVAPFSLNSIAQPAPLAAGSGSAAEHITAPRVKKVVASTDRDDRKPSAVSAADTAEKAPAPLPLAPRSRADRGPSQRGRSRPVAAAALYRLGSVALRVSSRIGRASPHDPGSDSGRVAAD
jgi:cell division protease FtsH